MDKFIKNFLLGLLIGSNLLTPLAMLLGNVEGLQVGVIIYILSSLLVQELNPRSRSFKRENSQYQKYL
ncbi:hypothetical protein NIES2107_08590 [Nostoc carneum NIES-2107]|nr:hypothetical protein NIES2107_08590 [Nostoc carneum NIES-2107]